MKDLKYDVTIEIMAMNQPTGSDDVLKAAVTGDIAWETDETYFIEPLCITVGIMEKAVMIDRRIKRTAFEKRGTYSLFTLNYETEDANDVLYLIAAGFHRAIGIQKEKDREQKKPVRDIQPTPSEEYLLDYGDKFCKLFKCAAKVTAVWPPDGTWTCCWYSPDGNLNRDVKGLKGEPSQSLEDFIKEWDNAH